MPTGSDRGGVKPSRSVASWPCNCRPRTLIRTVVPCEQLTLTVSCASGVAAGAVAVLAVEAVVVGAALVLVVVLDEPALTVTVLVEPPQPARIAAASATIAGTRIPVIDAGRTPPIVLRARADSDSALTGPA
jgi:hypothetical protein